MEVNETATDAPEVTTGPSKKKQFAAVALSTVVSIALTMGANYVIDQAAERVKNAIARNKENKTS
jgi:hypothetical protein